MGNLASIIIIIILVYIFLVICMITYVLNKYISRIKMYIKCLYLLKKFPIFKLGTIPIIVQIIDVLLL